MISTLTRPQLIHIAQIAALLLVVLLCMPALQRGFNRTVDLLAYPYVDDPLEGTLIHEARLIRDGNQLYQPIVPERFISAPYTPLHPLLLAQLPIDGVDAFGPGRWLSLLPMLAAGIIGALFVAIHTRSPALGLITIVLWICFPPVQLWATRVKPDALALAINAAGLLVGSLRRGRYVHWAALIFTVAFLAKQTGFAAPLALGVALLITDWRKAFIYAGIYLLGLGSTTLALQITTDGWALRHIFGLHAREWWSAPLMIKYIKLLVGQALPLVGLALLGVRSIRNHEQLLALCYVGTASLTMYGTGEVGAHHNHLLEPLLAWSIGAGMGLGAVAASSKHIKLGAGAAALLLVAQVLLLRPIPVWYGGEFDAPDSGRYVAMIAAQPGEVLTDNIGLLISADKPIRYDDPSTMGPAIESGLWDPSQLHADIAAKRFNIIVMHFDVESQRRDATRRWTDETLAIMLEHYELLYRDTMFTFVPRAAP